MPSRGGFVLGSRRARLDSSSGTVGRGTDERDQTVGDFRRQRRGRLNGSADLLLDRGDGQRGPYCVGFLVATLTALPACASRKGALFFWGQHRMTPIAELPEAPSSALMPRTQYVAGAGNCGSEDRQHHAIS